MKKFRLMPLFLFTLFFIVDSVTAQRVSLQELLDRVTDLEVQVSDISLAFNGVTVPLVALDIQTTLPDGSFVYFLGITSDVQTDTTAQISTIGQGFFLYNVDDIIRAEDPAGLLGDVNLDGVVNLLDVAPFVDRLSTGTFQAEADINGDGVVNLLDVDPFVALLSGG